MSEPESDAEPTDAPNDAPIIKVEFLPFEQQSFWEPAAVIRPEYNIGKFAGVIFASPYAKNLHEVRRQDWRVTRGNDQANASLIIKPLVGEKTPTTTTLRVYLALLQVWTHDGKPESGLIHFSARQLSKIIGWKWSGKATANRIREHIQVLQGTALTWVFSFSQSDGNIVEKISDMSILTSAEYHERRDLLQDEKFKGLHRVRFNPDLIENMLQGHVRPINYLALTQIANDTTLTLYTKIDLYLANRPKWERRSKELFEHELGLTAARYDHRRIRLQRLKEFVTALNGVELMDGILRCDIEWTSDRQDHKLVAWKQPNKKPKLKNRPVAICTVEEAEMMATDLDREFAKYPNGSGTKQGYLIYLCRHYPHDLIRRALATAKADYDKYDKAIGAVFAYELKQLVDQRSQLVWYAPDDGRRR